MLRVTVLSLEGKNYPLSFSINSAEKIENEYFPIENIGDALIDPKKYNVNSMEMVKNIIYILAEEGIAYCKFKGIKKINKKTLEMKLPDIKEMFKFIECEEIQNITKALFECLTNSKKKP